jgi:hypothetical protein
LIDYFLNKKNAKNKFVKLCFNFVVIRPLFFTLKTKALLLSKGTKVRLKNSNDEGVVVALLNNGMVSVLLKDADITIPVFPEALEAIYDSKKTKAKVVPGKQSKVTAGPPAAQINAQYTILKSKGIQLAFDPIFQGDDVPEKYQIYLINDTSSDIIYQVSLRVAGEQEFTETGKLNKVSLVQIGDIFYDELNDSPTFDLDFRRITTDGTGAQHLKTLKIKAKQFFRNIETAPILNRKVHIYKVFENLKAERKDQQEEDLKTYTQKNAQPVFKKPASAGTTWSPDVKAKAEFKAELDLHIDALTEDHSSLNKAEILQYQIKAFEKYMEEALKLGVDRVFIIHGVGKGKLRNIIATRLIQMRFIKTFKNEYHAKYGFGATEVIFD